LAPPDGLVSDARPAGASVIEVMNALVVVVRDVFPEQTSQVVFAQHHQMLEEFSTNRSRENPCSRALPSLPAKAGKSRDAWRLHVPLEPIAERRGVELEQIPCIFAALQGSPVQETGSHQAGPSARSPSLPSVSAWIASPPGNVLHVPWFLGSRPCEREPRRQRGWSLPRFGRRFSVGVRDGSPSRRSCDRGAANRVVTELHDQPLAPSIGRRTLKRLDTRGS